jgi:hypothetical protein
MSNIVKSYLLDENLLRALNGGDACGSDGKGQRL